MPRTVSFTVRDYDDVQHTYTCTLHPASEGQAVMWTLASLIAAPLAGALKGLLPLLDQFKGAGVRGMLDDPNALASLKNALGALDFGAMGMELGRSLADPRLAPLVREILSRTQRDDRPLTNALLFDEAYSGNYGELLNALGEVVAANRFLSLPGMTLSAR